MKFRKYELYMGLNDKDTKIQMVDTLDAYKIVSNQVAQRFDGGTVFNASGVYKHENGDVVIENTIKIEIILFNESQPESDVREFVEYLKTTFNQESLAIQRSMIESDLW